MGARPGNKHNPTGKGGPKKGDPSRNASGRPGGYAEFREMCRVEGSGPAFRRLMEAIDQGDHSNAIAAARVVLSYAWGQPSQAIDVNTTTTVTITDARRALAEEVSRIIKPRAVEPSDSPTH